MAKQPKKLAARRRMMKELAAKFGITERSIALAEELKKSDPAAFKRVWKGELTLAAAIKQMWAKQAKRAQRKD